MNQNNIDSSIHNFTNRDGKRFSVDCFAVTKKKCQREKWQTQREKKRSKLEYKPTHGVANLWNKNNTIFIKN